MVTEIAILTHTVATLAMAGIIWFVQVVHYPLFSYAAEPEDGGSFARFAHAHQKRTTIVVAPLMLLELATATWLLFPVSGAPVIAARSGWLLLAAIWISTAFVQVPLHRRLALGFDASKVQRLVTGNWLRTALWSGRAGIALWIVAARQAA